MKSNPTPFWRSASVVRNRGCIADRCHTNSGLVNSTDRRFATAARALYSNLNLPHSGVGRFACGFARGLLRGERRSLSRSAEPAGTGRRLRNQISLRIGDRDHRVIERCSDMNDPDRNIFLLFLFINLLFWCCHKLGFKFLVSGFKLIQAQTRNLRPETYFLPGAFFFATAAFLGPFLVRAFVCVR